MSQQPPSSDMIRHYVNSGDIKVIRSGQPDNDGPNQYKKTITGIYVSKSVADLFPNTHMQQAPVSKEAQALSKYELGHNLYHLSVSDFNSIYNGLALLNDAQALALRDRSQDAPNLPFPG